MKLSKIYSNLPTLFKEVEFNSGLNVVMAEIRLPKSTDKDTHNKGKTLLGRLIDFCLLSQKNNNFFLFKNYAIFKDFVFFLEIDIDDKRFLTLRRSVNKPSKISFKLLKEKNQNLAELPNDEWDHVDVPYERSKQILDSILDLRGLSPWTYRNMLGYLLRGQNDYTDVFQLSKFKGKHIQWKPFLCHILGFNAQLAHDHYKSILELEEKQKEELTLSIELQDRSQSLSSVDGLILIKENEINTKKFYLNDFDFTYEDKQETKKLVMKFDTQISQYNDELYTLNANRRKINEILSEDNFEFNIEETSKTFEEVGILFEGQIKRSFEQLVEFKKTITKERKKYLIAELEETTQNINKLQSKSLSAQKERAKSISFIKDTSALDKYKEISNELVNLEADVQVLHRQKASLKRLENIRAKIREIQSTEDKLRTEVIEDITKTSEDQTSTFSQVRLFFDKIIKKVISRNALINADVNTNGNPEFSIDILDNADMPTSADEGNTYKKLLCVSFDMAVIHSRQAERFPKFMFHDGALESLDDRKKIALIDLLRENTKSGIQHIITCIDSEVPTTADHIPYGFHDDEIILRLHDDGPQGRLFMIDSW